MEGYSAIGTVYLLRKVGDEKKLLWSVIENNSNDKTSTIEVIEECSKKGMKIKVNAKWLYENEPVGPILPPPGEIIIENGIEFVKKEKTKEHSKVLKPTKVH